MFSHRSIAKIIWALTAAIIGMGLVALYSASFNNTRVGQDVFYDQLWCAVVGLAVMYLFSRLNYRKFYDVAYVLYGLNVAMLAVVLVIGREALGATRWLNIAGMTFQPSELTKLSVILMLGRYFSDRRPRLSFTFSSRFYSFLSDLLYPCLLTLVSVGLIFKQPDLGTAILVFSIFVIMLFVSNINGRLFMGFIGSCLAVVPLGWHVLKDYQKDRLLVFLNPNIDPLGAGYTIIQSKIAVGSGGLVGKGWLAGTQNQLNFLPERHTDFIFSVVGEEWGLFGTLMMLVCFLAIVAGGFAIAEHIKDKFGQFVAVGIVSILGLQVVINIGMVIGLFPVVGVTLPLVSYGRTSFMVTMMMLGFLLNVSKKRTIF